MWSTAGSGEWGAGTVEGLSWNSREKVQMSVKLSASFTQDQKSALLQKIDL